MENDADVRELLKLIFGKKPTIPEEMVAHSPIPTDVLNEDFSKKMKDVLLIRKHIVNQRWINFFDRNSRDMLCSHQMYLWHIIYACLFEHNCNRNIFDSFNSACVFVMNISKETLAKTGLDFRDLNPDIIIVFYRNVLKFFFPKHGGFSGFVEHIRRHEYLKWNCDKNDLAMSDYDTASASFKPDLDEKLKKEYSSFRPSEEISVSMKIKMYQTVRCLVREVLSTTSVHLPTLLSESELIKRLVASRKRQLANKADRNKRVEANSTFETPHGDWSLNSVSKTNYIAQHKADIARHESIIQAVIRHNHSKTSRHENVNNQIQVEAERTLEHLRNSIKSLTKVLDECNKE